MKCLIKSTLLLAAGITPFSLVAASGGYVTKSEFNALIERVASLEEVLASFKTDVVEQVAETAIATRQPTAENKGSFIEEVVDVIHAREEDAFYPWMDDAKWDQIKVGMPEEDVYALLGRPTMNDPSMHKKIDRFYTYSGRRVGSGKKVKGVVRFYRGVVKNFDRPELAGE